MAIAPIVGAGLGLIQALIAARQGQQANQLQQQNLQFQREQARRQERLATAARTDPYGNKTRYDDILNEWINELTPTQQQILRAGEREQLLSVTEDATRARDLRRGQAKRAGEAGKEFNRSLAEYRFRPPPSQGAVQDDIVRSLTLARQKGLGEGKKVLMGQAQRMGRGKDIPALMQAADRQFGENLEETTLRGKQAGQQMSSALRGEHESRYGDALSRFSQLASGVNDTPIRFSSLPQTQPAQQDAMQRALASALDSGSARVGGAMSDLASGIRSNVPDFSAMINALGQFGRGKVDTVTGEIVDPYAFDNNRNRGNIGVF